MFVLRTKSVSKSTTLGWYVPGRSRKLKARRDSECGVRTLTGIESLARDNGPKLCTNDIASTRLGERPGRDG